VNLLQDFGNRYMKLKGYLCLESYGEMYCCRFTARKDLHSR
jgi:hypothetical protein